MADETMENPVAHRFAPGEPVRLTMTQRAVDGTQVPNHSMGTVLSAIDEEGSRFEVEFPPIDGRRPDFRENPQLTDEAREGIKARGGDAAMIVAHVPVAFLESIAPPPEADHRSGAEREQGDDMGDDDFVNRFVVGPRSSGWGEVSERYDHPVKEVSRDSLPDRVIAAERGPTLQHMRKVGMDPEKTPLHRVTAGKVGPESRNGEGVEFTFYYRAQTEESRR